MYRLNAFIWDMDGTVLDSYGAIVTSLYRAYASFGVEIDMKEIRKEVLTTSVGAFMDNMEKRTGITYDTLEPVYHDIAVEEQERIRPIHNAPEILRFLKDRGIRSFVFTHRGLSTLYLLEKLGLNDLFEDIVTARDGFPRKPDPSAVNHLVEKHSLDRETTAYVGDRIIDVRCAVNAGIKSILYLEADSVVKAAGMETFVIHDLINIRDLI